MGASLLAGTGPLIRVILRRDRIRLSVWVLAIAGFVLFSVPSLPELYPTEVERQARAGVMENPAAIAFSGPGHGVDDYTIGAMVANELLLYGILGVALMSVFLMVRHTRAEEESTRTELVRAAAVGRHADAAAALVVVVGANVVVGGVTALGLAAALEELSLVGSLTFGMSMAAAGLVFAGAGTLTAQLTEHSRGASGLGAVAIGVAVTVRAAGDMGNGTLSWLSPIGWSQATRSYVDERWWPLGLSVVLALTLVAMAFGVSARRDVGAGVLRPRRGAPTASVVLTHPAGFVLRLQRGMLIGWGSGVFAFGLVYGTLVSEVQAFVEQNAAMEELLQAAGGTSLLDAWLALVVLLLAVTISGYGIQAAMRLRSEETGGRAEPVLAAGLSRSAWAASHFGVTMAGSAALLVAAMLGVGTTGAISTGDFSLLPRLLGAGLVYVPAVWLIVGLVAALSGLAPRAAGLAWVVFAYSIFVAMLGGFLDLPAWLGNLSPFAHVPALPAVDLRVMPLVVILLGAGVLLAAGVAGIRRRDLTLT